MKKIIGFLLILLGAALAFAGWIFRGAGGVVVSGDPLVAAIPRAVVGYLRTMIGLVESFLPDAALDLLQISSSGFLYLGGAVGGVLLLVGGFFAFAERRKIDAGKNDEEPTVGGLVHAGEEFDESKESIDLPVGDDAETKIARLVQFEQKILTPRDCENVVKAYSPKTAGRVKIMSTGFLNVFARKLLAAERIRAGRARQGISPKQFGNLQERLVELEREIIGRLLMPKNPDKIPAEAREHIGFAFDLTGQQKVQQQSSTEADDWIDISMNNIETALANSGQSTPASDSLSSSPPASDPSSSLHLVRPADSDAATPSS